MNIATSYTSLEKAHEIGSSQVLWVEKENPQKFKFINNFLVAQTTFKVGKVYEQNMPLTQT